MCKIDLLVVMSNSSEFSNTGDLSLMKNLETFLKSDKIFRYFFIGNNKTESKYLILTHLFINQ